MKIKYKAKRFQKHNRELIDLINQILDEYSRNGYMLTLRQTYYQLVARGYIPNNEKSYTNIGNLVNDARLAGLIDWHSIVDRTRFLNRNSHWNSPVDIIESAIESFALDKWENQPEYVEIWIEKDALIDIVGQACKPLDVPFFSCRGYTSQTAMWEAAQRIQEQNNLGKNCHIIHLGDHDPSGIDMSRDIFERMNNLFGADVELKRIALTMDQVEAYNPPPNPAKITDTRYERYISKYGNESWELDALDPTMLNRLITDNVLEFRDEKLYQETCLQEKSQLSELESIRTNYLDVIKYLKKFK